MIPETNDMNEPKITSIDYKKPYFIAEACANHMGDIDIAKKMITAAQKAGANCIKFQKRCIKELLTEEEYNAPHPVPYNSFGDCYGKHREAVEFDIKTHIMLSNFCANNNVEYSTSIFDLTSAKEIVENINPKFIKIPSACNNHIKLLEYIRDKYNGKIVISLGMTTKEEEQQIHEIFMHCNDRLIIMACTSGYPVPFKYIYLKEITRLKNSYRWLDAEIGFSCHGLGLVMEVAGFVLGASYFERHFTLDRTWKGGDQAASVEPKGLATIIRDLNVTYEALNFKPKEMDSIEIEQRNKLKYKGKNEQK